MKLWWLPLALAIGAISAYAMIPNEPIIYREVIVPARVIINREPDTIRTFIDRIRTIVVEPIQIATAPGGAQEQVQAFCQPTVIAMTDTVEVAVAVDPMLLLRTVSYDSRWAWRKDRLLLTGITNTGDLKAFDYLVRGGFTAAARSTDVLVQYPRTALIGDIWTGGSQIYTGFSIIKGLLGIF